MEPIKFKDMTPEQRSEIVEALVADAANVEVYQASGVWAGKTGLSLYTNSCYRIEPRQLVIPWDVLRPEIVYAAMDADGHVFGYSAQRQTRLDDTIAIDTTGVNWRESLVMRPWYEEIEK